MNWDRIEGNWKQFSGKVKEKWGDLTDDDMTSINGRRGSSKASCRSATATARTRFARRSTTGWATSNCSTKSMQEWPAEQSCRPFCHQWRISSTSGNTTAARAI